MTLYIAVIEVNEVWIDNQDGPIGDLKKYLDRKIGYGLGNRGKLKSSEIVKGESQWKQLQKRKIIPAGS